MYPSEPEQAKLSSRPMSEAAPSNLAAVQGITVGHWTDSQSATGCTVTLAPPGGMRAACAVRGRASGTRELDALDPRHLDRKSTRLNSSHPSISYAVFCLKKKKKGSPGRSPRNLLQLKPLAALPCN